MLIDTRLRDEFERYKQNPFVFVNPGGNWGDALIWWGAERLAEEQGLRYVTVDFTTFLTQEIAADAVIYIHGGGGFNRWTTGRAVKAFEKAVLTHAGVTIQGPQTSEHSADFIETVFQPLTDRVIAERVVFFARERLSHGLLNANAPSWVDVAIDIDTALHLNRDLFLERAGVFRQTYDLFGIREDNEASIRAHFRTAAAVRIDPARYADSFEHWLRLHAAARQIVTNRTHSAIAGAVLGTPTTLMSGSYHKNRSIWEFALRERGVTWAETHGELPLNRRKWLDPIDMALTVGGKSWKVRRALMRLKGVPSR